MKISALGVILLIHYTELKYGVHSSSKTTTDKHLIETLHAEFWLNISETQRKAPANACRAKLG